MQNCLRLKLLTLGVGDCLLLPLTCNTLEKGPCCYLSTVTWSSNKGSVDCFRREKLKRLATFDSLSVQMRLAARSRIHSRTIVCYLGGVWRPLESLERIYGGFPSVDPSGRFAGVPNLGKPSIERENRLRYNLVGYSNDRFFPHTNPYISNVTQQLMRMVTDARN